MSWNLVNTDVRYAQQAWSLQSDLAAPQQGWQIGDRSSATIDPVLSIRCSTPLSPLQEAYCQEGDLIVRYPQAEASGVGLDMRYEVISADEQRLVLQCTFALQTRDFEAHPELYVSVGKVSSPLLVTINTWSDSDLHAAIVIDPTDVAQGKLVTDEAGGNAILFFGEFMERGVIRKCRLRLIVATGDRSALRSESELESLCTAPLPLVS